MTAGLTGGQRLTEEVVFEWRDEGGETVNQTNTWIGRTNSTVKGPTAGKGWAGSRNGWGGDALGKTCQGKSSRRQVREVTGSYITWGFVDLSESLILLWEKYESHCSVLSRSKIWGSPRVSRKNKDKRLQTNRRQMQYPGDNDYSLDLDSRSNIHFSQWILWEKVCIYLEDRANRISHWIGCVAMRKK